MPTYEYACAACGHQWEETQRITEPPREVCPACSKAAAHRLISATSFILKGGGWYSDLYASPKPAKDKAANAENSGKPEAAQGKAPTEGASAASSGTTPGGSSASSGSGGSGGSSDTGTAGKASSTSPATSSN